MESHIVVGVQNSGDVFSQVSVQNRLDVAADVDCGGGEGMEREQQQQNLFKQ